MPRSCRPCAKFPQRGRTDHDRRRGHDRNCHQSVPGDAGPRRGPTSATRRRARGTVPPSSPCTGWPYDIQSFAEVAPVLAAAGYRGGHVRPRPRHDPLPGRRRRPQRPAGGGGLRCRRADGRARYRAGGPGGGSTGRGRSPTSSRRLWPDRGLVSVSGYLIGSQAANVAPLPPQAESAWWYQYYEHDPRRVRPAHLAARLAPMGLRRRHVRPDRDGLRQPGPRRRRRDPQLPLAARPRRIGRSTTWSGDSPRPRRSPSRA